MEEQMENICFQIISAAGGAKSMLIEAMQMAKDGDFAGAKEKIEQADACYAEGHSAHMDLLVRQANGEEIPFSLLLVHAEDQMMSVETVKILVEEIVALYEKR